MRTTITLDDDVARKLKARVRESGKTFKDVVNESIRAGLAPSKRPVAAKFTVRAKNMGVRRGLDYDNVWKLIEELEGPDFR